MDWRSGNYRVSTWYHSPDFNPKYTNVCLDFVTRTKDPEVRIDPAYEYTFVNGLQHPLYCNPTIGLDIPNNYKTYAKKDKSTATFGPRNFAPIIPKYCSARSRWGVDMKNVKKDVKIIPYNINTVRRQQRELSPLMHWINTHQADFERHKPNFASNRYIVKRILAMSELEPSYTFMAERINGTIYLRELHPASDRDRGTDIGALFESIMLKDPENMRNVMYDMNETTYGIYLGNVENISILFSAEIDGFWGRCSEVWDSPSEQAHRPLADRIVEVKTIHRNMFSEPTLQKFSSKMLTAWAQCFLVGVDRILFGVMNQAKVAYLQLVEMEDVLTRFSRIPGYEDVDQPRAHTLHLHDTLSRILENVREDSPAAQYIVTANYKSNNRRSFTQVTKLAPLDYRP